MTAGVYKIENKINHKVYIGCSKNIENRWYHHKFEAKKKKIIHNIIIVFIKLLENMG